MSKRKQKQRGGKKAHITAAKQNNKQVKNPERAENATTDKNLIAEPILIGVLIAFLTVIIGLITNSFWEQHIVPPFKALIDVASVLSAFVGFWGIKVTIRSEIKSSRLKNLIIAAILGISIGVGVTVFLSNCGIRLEIVNTPLQDLSSDTDSEKEPEVPPVQPESSHDSSQKTSDDDLTEEPEIEIDVSISTDTDVLDPNTVLQYTDSTTADNAFVPDDQEQTLLSVIDSNLELSSLDFSAENKTAWCSVISDTVKEKVNSDSQPSDDVVNGNSEFTRRTRKANEIEKNLADNGMDYALLLEKVRLREEAYEIYQIKPLRHLLASDYHSLARIYSRNKRWEDAYGYYLKSIEFEVRYIQLCRRVDDDYFKHLYNIAILYQCIGDMTTIEESYRIKAYFLSACFFEAVCKNTFDEADEKFGFFSSYYAGMINHKLSLLSWRNRSKEAGYYIVDAIAYYQLSLEFEDYRKQRSYQYQYLSELCHLAQQYISRYGYVDGMLKLNEYKQQETEYSKLAK